MKAKIYWTAQHMTRGIHDLRFAATCWWLSQRVDFLQWRWRLDGLMPQLQPVPAPVRVEQGNRYAMRSLSRRGRSRG
jgi:hypothetical protein